MILAIIKFQIDLTCDLKYTYHRANITHNDVLTGISHLPAGHVKELEPGHKSAIKIK